MTNRHPASFRDPSGFVFAREDVLYRQVNHSYRPTYDSVKAAGLFHDLAERGLLIPHDEVDVPAEEPDLGDLVLRPEPVSFVSYPYEWSPGQLRDAALATLEVQRIALTYGYTLKDASAFNVQFVEGKAVLIDTLSFEEYHEGRPWIAYGQFCRHFLAPLALMCRVDPRLGQMTKHHIDGIPLDLAAALMPPSSRYSWGLGVHLHAHAKAQRRHAGGGEQTKPRPVSLRATTGLMESLSALVRRLRWEPPKSAWSDYYALRESYTEDSIDHKRRAVVEALESALRQGPLTQLWDLGANTGMFSQLACEVTGAEVVALELDLSAVEIHWRNRNQRVLPLVSDLSNPSPALGWSHRERASLLQRGPADLVMALALVHHVAIGNNVPLPQLAEFLARSTRGHAVVEWVPKTDPMVRRMLATREDIFADYELGAFRKALSHFFAIVDERHIGGSERTLLHLRRRAEACDE